MNDWLACICYGQTFPALQCLAKFQRLSTPMLLLLLLRCPWAASMGRSCRWAAGQMALTCRSEYQHQGMLPAALSRIYI
jgi:hypothetical protein